ncbi:hypothetical protein [Chryseobacterium artocarpi]|uniref:hypothetical protein n=1 Tax=Chryseobacterium artocarpi TaxID=1414727 RepID=UPI003F40D08D
MKLTKYLSILFVLGLQLICYGQKSEDNQKLLQAKAEAFTQQIINLITEKNYKALEPLTTQKVYCNLCFEAEPEKKAFVNKNIFYSKHANAIFNKELLERLKRNETKFSPDGSDPGFGDRDYIVLYTINRPNEFGDGHEGAQFVFWLKEKNGTFKLSGVETIP